MPEDVHISQGFGAPLQRLAERYGLGAGAVARLRALGELIVRDDSAPTAVRDPAHVRDDHLADALVALNLAELHSARTIADLGAGPGVPGLPLAAALPNASVALVESNLRKCEFMTRAAELMGLRNVAVVNARIETWSTGRGQQDVVTVRALAPLNVVMEYAAPLLRIGGTMVAWRGAREPQVEADGSRAAAILGLELRAPLRVLPYDGAEHRHLHIATKVFATPDRFPRRDGVARKRPLGRL